MAEFRPAPRPKNALDNRKLHLTAPCPTAAGKTSALTVQVFTAEKTGEPNPRITVFTRDPEDQGERNGYGKIQANLDPVVFYALMEKLRRIATGSVGKEDAVPADGEDKVKMENKNYIFPGGKKSETPVPVSEIQMGKDAEGVVWISVLAKDRPRIKFPFIPNQFHTLFHRTGEQYSKGEASELWALGWIRLMEQMIPPFLISDYKDIPYDPNNSNRGGGGNRGSYGGQNQGGAAPQRQAAVAVETSDDDIPW
jgi:hypothetical protein